MSKNFQPHRRTRQKTAQQSVKHHRSHLTGGAETIDEGEIKHAPEQYSSTNTIEVTNEN